jgi:hypothetical protein
MLLTKAVFANFVAFKIVLGWLIGTPGCSLSAPINLISFVQKQQSFRKEP